MTRVEREIFTTGIRDVFLRASVNAIPFYANVGYRVADRAVMQLGGIGVAVAIMDKRLTLEGAGSLHSNV
jgi:hypothetical protein